jgi:hypothetical protein
VKLGIKSLAAVACFGLTLTAGAAHAALISFDDLVLVSPTAGLPVPDGYGGFNWNNVRYVSQANGFGYETGTVSPQNVIYDPFGSGGSFTSVSGTFSLDSAYFTGARTDQQVVVRGWSGGIGGTLLQTMTFNVLDTEPTFIVFNWSGIDAVSFDGLASTLSQVVIDDISVSSTPVPGALPLFATGLAGVGMFLYRRKRTAAAA